MGKTLARSQLSLTVFDFHNREQQNNLKNCVKEINFPCENEKSLKISRHPTSLPFYSNR